MDIPAASMKPGMNPPKKTFPMLAPEERPYKTIGIEGGTMMPK